MTTATPARTLPAPPAGGPAARPAPGQGPSIDPMKLLIKYMPLFVAAVIVGAVVGAGAHFGLRYSFPIYTSYVTYQVLPATEAVGEAATGSGVEDELQRFMATEVQYMISERMLGAAAVSPKMGTEARSWSRRFSTRAKAQDGATIESVDPGDGLEDLQDRVSARVIPETSFIRLSVWWYDKEDVAGLVNVVREEYEKDFAFRSNLDNNSRQAALSDSIRGYRTQITNLQTQRDRVLQESGIDSLDQRLNEALRELDLSMEALTDIRNTISARQVSIDEMARQRESPAGIVFDPTIRMEVENDPLMLNLKRDHNTIEATLAGLREQFGPAHRDVRALEARVNGSRARIEAERQKLLVERFDAREEAYRQELAQAQKQEADLTTIIEEAKARAATLTQVKVQVDDFQEQIDRLTQSLVDNDDQLKQLEAVVSSGAGTRVIVTEAPKVPTEVAFPKIYFMIPGGVALVLGLAVAFVVVFELIDQRVKGPSDVTLIPRTRVLGVIPHADDTPEKTRTAETVFRDQPRGVMAESVRQLRSNVVKRMQAGGHKTLLVASVLPGSGTTSVAVNLAMGTAALNQRVLLIDANLRRPKIHALLGLAEGPGLGDVLSGSGTLDSGIQGTPVEGAGTLSVLCAGSQAVRAFESLASPRMADLLAQAASRFDLVVIDAAPAIVSGDAQALAARCDASLLVVRAFQEKRGMVARIRNELGEARAEFLGVVVNAVRPTAGGYLRRNIKVAHEYQSKP